MAFCGAFRLKGSEIHNVPEGLCLDTNNDEDPSSWGLWGCHGGSNQQFQRPKMDEVEQEESSDSGVTVRSGNPNSVCHIKKNAPAECFDVELYESPTSVQ